MRASSSRSARFCLLVCSGLASLSGCFSQLGLEDEYGSSDPSTPPARCDQQCAPGWECLGNGCQWREMLDAVNAARQKGADCGALGNMPPAGALQFDSALTTAALGHALTMAQNGCFSHDGTGQSPCPDGTPCQRIAQAGYRWRAVGENISLNATGVTDAVQGWLDSDGHCANMLNPEYVHFGAGEADNGDGDRYFVQAFGAPGGGTVATCG